MTGFLVSVIAAASLTVISAQAPQGEGAAPHVDKLTKPSGFSIDVYASGVKGARSMALAPDGTLFVGTRSTTVYAIVDKDGDHKADSVTPLVTNLRTPNGLAFRDGALYVGELNRIVRFDNVLAAIKSGALSSLTPKVIVDGLPSELMHGWKYLAFGPDGYLYYQIGAPCNICDRGDPFAAIWRVKPDGGAPEIFARGVRNSVGLAWHPDTKELWFTDNGRDMLGDEMPNDELNHALKPGLHFGYPYCHQGNTTDPEFGKDHPCSDYTPPVQFLGPHVAALGLHFYVGSMFPAEYQKKLFIVNRGSWNRTTEAGPIGYRIMLATVEGDKVTKYEPFSEGFLQGRQPWGRPVDLLEMPDGSLLVSDDTAGAIYRISYKK